MVVWRLPLNILLLQIEYSFKSYLNCWTGKVHYGIQFQILSQKNHICQVGTRLELMKPRLEQDQGLGKTSRARRDRDLITSNISETRQDLISNFFETEITSSIPQTERPKFAKKIAQKVSKSKKFSDRNFETKKRLFLPISFQFRDRDQDSCPTLNCQC